MLFSLCPISSRVILLPSLAVGIRLPFFVTPLNLIVGDKPCPQSKWQLCERDCQSRDLGPGTRTIGGKVHEDGIHPVWQRHLEAKEGLIILAERIALPVAFYHMIYGIGPLLCCYKILASNLPMLSRAHSQFQWCGSRSCQKTRRCDWDITVEVDFLRAQVQSKSPSSGDKNVNRDNPQTFESECGWQMYIRSIKCNLVPAACLPNLQVSGPDQ